MNKFMLEANPITAILIVYNPVFTMIPPKWTESPIFVCKKAVTKPEQTPAAIAANNPNIG